MIDNMKRGEMYPEYIRLVKSLREEMINQTLDETSTDLYHALYGGVERAVYQTEIDLFELKWLQKHWDMIVEAIQNADATSSEKEKCFQPPQQRIWSSSASGIIRDLILLPWQKEWKSLKI